MAAFLDPRSGEYVTVVIDFQAAKDRLRPDPAKVYQAQVKEIGDRIVEAYFGFVNKPLPVLDPSTDREQGA